MGFEANTEVMRGEATKWDELQTAMTTVANRFRSNRNASGAFSIVGKALGDEHDDLADQLTTWSSQGATRFGAIGDTLLWIASNYTGTDADQQKRYPG